MLLSIADPDPGSSAFFVLVEIRDKFCPDPRSNPYFWERSNNFFSDEMDSNIFLCLLLTK